MTSDRGTSGDAEMQLGNTTPVTPKTAGLNPNANVFHSKSPSTPPEPEAEPDVEGGGGGGGGGGEGEWTEGDTPPSSALPATPDGAVMVNGDEEKPLTVAFPPTPESPMQITDYPAVNGTSPSLPEVLFSPTDSNEDAVPLDGSTVPADQLKALLKNQLEYYFSRDNLASDSYLVSQMDADQYVPISTVAGFNQIKRLTNDLDLVISVLRESSHVQVDESGEKVRPLHKRCIVILREVPDSTPVSEVEKLFSGENCPRFISCEFAHNNSWYVTFDSDEDAQRAYQYLREDVRCFLGRPIMARIKAKPLLRSTFVPKNGFKAQYDPNMAYAGQRAYTTFAQVPTSTQYILTPQPQQAAPPAPQPPVVGQPTAQPTQPPTQQSFPFFPPNTVMHAAAWGSNPMPFFDPGTAFAANGYTPTGTYKLTTGTSRHTSYANMRNRNQLKPHGRNSQGSGDRNSGDMNRLHERHLPMSGGMTASRGGSRNESAHAHGRGGPHANHNHSHNHSHNHAYQHNVRRDMQVHNHTAVSSHHGNETMNSNRGIQATSATTTSSEVTTVRDQTTQPSRRGGGYRSRRRRDDDSSRSNRQNSTSLSAKDSSRQNTEMPKFELESTSFPPLPGSTNSTTTGDVFENKMSDVVKGTAKPLTRDLKAATPPAQPAVTTATMSNTTSPSPPSSQTRTAASTVAAQAATATIVMPTTTASTTVSSVSTTTTQSHVSSASTVTTATAAAVVATSSASLQKEGKKEDTNATIASLPTPPQSPNKVSKSTSTDNVPPVSTTTSKEDASTSIHATTQTPAHMPSKPAQNDSSGQVRLSYAQMAQRAKERAEREAHERQQKPATDESKKDEGPPPGSATSSRASTTLRDQTQISGARHGGGNDLRKGEEGRSEIRMGPASRRAKENRRDLNRSDSRYKGGEWRRDRDVETLRSSSAK